MKDILTIICFAIFFILNIAFFENIENPKFFAEKYLLPLVPLFLVVTSFFVGKFLLFIYRCTKEHKILKYAPLFMPPIIFVLASSWARIDVAKYYKLPPDDYSFTIYLITYYNFILLCIYLAVASSFLMAMFFSLKYLYSGPEVEISYKSGAKSFIVFLFFLSILMYSFNIKNYIIEYCAINFEYFYLENYVNSCGKKIKLHENGVISYINESIDGPKILVGGFGAGHFNCNSISIN